MGKSHSVSHRKQHHAALCVWQLNLAHLWKLTLAHLWKLTGPDSMVVEMRCVSGWSVAEARDTSSVVDQPSFLLRPFSTVRRKR